MTCSLLRSSAPGVMGVSFMSGPDLDLAGKHGRTTMIRKKWRDGEDRSEIIWREGKGAIPELRFVRLPSLPAEINTDDSDPLGTA